MGAYDKNGRLLRAAPERDDKAEGEEEVAEEEYNHPLMEGPQKAAAEKTKSKGELAPETVEDLRPFPLNRDFRSQSVLSEDLRNAIYDKVVKDGMSVRVVSAELGVSMERVGAVVRLKQLEHDWVQQVRTFLSPGILQTLPNPNDETQKFRLVLKTPTWLHNRFTYLIHRPSRLPNASTMVQNTR